MSQAYRVTHNGVEKCVGTHNECFAYILRHQSASVDHALKHEGWKIEPVDALPLPIARQLAAARKA